MNNSKKKTIHIEEILQDKSAYQSFSVDMKIKKKLSAIPFATQNNYTKNTKITNKISVFWNKVISWFGYSYLPKYALGIFSLIFFGLGGILLWTQNNLGNSQSIKKAKVPENTFIQPEDFAQDDILLNKQNSQILTTRSSNPHLEFNDTIDKNTDTTSDINNTSSDIRTYSFDIGEDSLGGNNKNNIIQRSTTKNNHISNTGQIIKDGTTGNRTICFSGSTFLSGYFSETDTVCDSYNQTGDITEIDLMKEIESLLKEAETKKNK